MSCGLYYINTFELYCTALKLLIDDGADINKTIEHGGDSFTLLQDAVYNNAPYCVQALLCAGAEDRIATFKLKYGGLNFISAMKLAEKLEGRKKFSFLLKLKLRTLRDVETYLAGITGSTDKEEINSVFCAALATFRCDELLSRGIIRQFMTAGVDCNSSSGGRWDETPLMCPSVNGRKQGRAKTSEILTILLRYGAKIDQLDSDKRTALHWQLCS